MKKLALALVCLMGVAFFTSCDPENIIENADPTIVFATDSGYLVNGQAIDVNTAYPLKVTASANPDTQTELSRLVITGNGQTMLDSTISGQTFVFEGSFTYPYSREVIVPEYELKATVTDADGKTASATIVVSVNVDDTLEETPIEWVKIGYDGDDISAYGLVWERTYYKSPFAHIKADTDCVFYVIEEGSDYETIVTATDLARYYANLLETARPAEEYKVDVNASGTYDDLLITKDAAGNYHAIYIEKAKVEVLSDGTKVTITGKAK